MKVVTIQPNVFQQNQAVTRINGLIGFIKGCNVKPNTELDVMITGYGRNEQTGAITLFMRLLEQDDVLVEHLGFRKDGKFVLAPIPEYKTMLSRGRVNIWYPEYEDDLPRLGKAYVKKKFLHDFVDVVSIEGVDAVDDLVFNVDRQHYRHDPVISPKYKEIGGKPLHKRNSYPGIIRHKTPRSY